MSAKPVPLSLKRAPLFRLARRTSFLLLSLAVFPAFSDDPDPTIVFGGSARYPPFEWKDREGQAHGFLIELEDAIARQGGRRAEHRLLEWSQVLAGLRSGGIDVVPMFESDARAKDFRFTEAFYYVTHGIYGSPGNQGLTGPEDLSGKRVAVVERGYAMNRLAGPGIDARLVPRSSIPAALEAVVDGQADVALVAQATARRTMDEWDMALKALSPPLWPRPYGFAVSQGRPDLHDWISRNFRLVVVSGQYQGIYDRWQGDLIASSIGWQTLLRRFGYVLLPILLIAGIGFLWSWQLRRQVARRTRELDHELHKRRSAESRLQYWARHDHLTGLPNRAEFVRRVEEAFNPEAGEAQPGLIMAVRLPELDSFISGFGYGTGEQLLNRFGDRLPFRDEGVGGHFGRGVFGLALPGSTDPEEVMTQLGAPIEVAGLELDPQLVAGVCRIPEHGRNVEELVRFAEMAMAEAHGRNRWWLEYEPGMEPDPNDLLIVGDFKRYADSGLRVVLQPQVDLQTGEVVGAEVLVRWHHPDLGDVSPARFVPLLERAGTTYRLTRYVLRQAVAAGVELRQAGTPVPTSINVSAVDLIESDLGEVVRAALEEGRASGGDLCIEMTETTVIEDPDQVRSVVKRLGGMGVASSLDDFGVGYSSLGYLSAFPIDELKIDRRFVQAMVQSERNDLIVRSTISLAHSLGLRVVGEGVEDWDTVEALREAGCDRAQGFVFCAPVSWEEFRKLVASRFL